MHRRFTFPWLLMSLMSLGVGATAAAAQPGDGYDAKSARLAGLTSADIVRIAPHLERGPVALVEFADTDGGELPGINLVSVVHAPAKTVMALLRRPQDYPRFMRTLDAVELVEQQTDAIVYDWRWQMALLELSGRNAMRVYEPPAERPERGYRITIDSQHGDLGRGRISMRILPRGAAESLVVTSIRLDLREANYVARKVARAARSVNRAANMSLAYSMLLSVRREAERSVGYRAPATSQTGPLVRPVIDRKAILPLLLRGDLILHELNGDRLDQVAVLGLIHRTPSIVREVMHDADAFGSALMPGSSAKVVSVDAGVTTFDWDIDLPLVGVSGRMQLRDQHPEMAVEAIDGALTGGRWHFDTSAFGEQATLMTAWARFDLRKSTWLVSSLMEADAYLGHGMTAASQVMLLRALRSRANKRGLPAEAAPGN